MAEEQKNSARGLVDLITTGLSQTIQSVLPTDWFGPTQPLLQNAPPDTEVRILDYRFGQNQFYNNRLTETGIGHRELRALADNYDILRLVIETRKDQVTRIPWSFRVRPKDKESKASHSARNANDPRVKELNDMFRYPDMERDWITWIRAVLEEVFVVDALSLAPRWDADNENKMLGLDVIDGSTIFRLIDTQGRTPAAPSVAYQQILKGVPAIDLTTRDLIYKPRNYRAHKIYGFSPVEQIIITVNTALRRQQQQLYYFTEGNIPEAFASVPDTWSADQTKQFQDMFDTLAGNQAKKSRVRFIPKLEDLVFTKDKILMDQFDEWLARVICFAFSVSPQPFTKMMNRATAANAAEAATQEGLVPLLNYLESVFTFIVERYMGIDDIEFGFLDDEEADQLKQAQIDKIYLSCGKVSIDELRERDGEDPIGMSNAVITATGPVPLKPFLNGGQMADGLPQHTNPPQQQQSNQAQLALPPGNDDESDDKEVRPKPTQKRFRRKWSY